jgi:imidazolonepropionase-like amidohydrolase
VSTRTVFHGGDVFDGEGTDPAPGDVVVSDGRIVEVGVGLDGDEGVDCTGRTILPGLFDCHVHVTMNGIDTVRRLSRPFSYQFFEAARNLKATLATGITTIRDAAGADLGIQQAVDDGLIAGPRMQISINALSQTGGHVDGWTVSGDCVLAFQPHPGRPGAVVDGPDEMRKRVRELIRAGANVIKVCTSGGVLSPRDNPRHGHFREEELAVLMAEANAVGIPVMAHAQATDGIKAAVRAGIRSIEHGMFLDDEAIEMMLRAGTWLVPTLVAPLAVVEAAAGGARVPSEVVDKARDVSEEHRHWFSRAVAAGVKIAMGTDSGVGAHGTNLRELGLMHESGMAAKDVLRSATASSAELMGLRDELGTLAPGKRADLVIVDGDPYELSKLRSNIRSVYKDGALAVSQVAPDMTRG